jgi:putative endonuclease
VARELERRGFALVGQNVRVGRLEIDLIARRGSLIVICEVRARRSDRFMAPAESLDRRKLERVRRAATLWLARSGLRNVDVRLDVAAVVFDGPEPRLEYYEGAF